MPTAGGLDENMRCIGYGIRVNLALHTLMRGHFARTGSLGSGECSNSRQLSMCNTENADRLAYEWDTSTRVQEAFVSRRPKAASWCPRRE